MLGLLAAITTETAISMFCSGAGAAITLLCAGSEIKKRRRTLLMIHGMPKTRKRCSVLSA